MRKIVLTLALMMALAAVIATPMNAAVPVCVLGGPTAMDTNRQLAEGESFVLTDRPLVVNLQFRPTKDHPEQVGECMLPSHSEVAVRNGIMQWAKACGNNEVNGNIFVTPFTPLRGLPGRDGLQGLKGDTGRDGLQGLKGDTGKDFIPEDRFHGWCRFWSDAGCYALAGAALVGVGAVTDWYGLNKKDPAGTPPDADTGGAFIRAGLTLRGQIIPPSHGRGGGGFIGARIGW